MATRIGEMACWNPKCSCKDISVEITAAGTWQAKCHKCQFPTFGKQGTPVRRAMESLTTLDATYLPTPKAPATEAPKAEPAPTPKRVNSAFALGDL